VNQTRTTRRMLMRVQVEVACDAIVREMWEVEGPDGLAAEELRDAAHERARRRARKPMQGWTRS
jgi:hypothetical protein